MEPEASAHLIERAAKRLQETADLAGVQPGNKTPPEAATAARFEQLGPAPPAVPRLEIAALERAGLIGSGDPWDRVSEEFRLVQGQLLQNMPAVGSMRSGSLVMLTSSRPGEGKSFVSLNLAASIARYCKRAVLLVDCDSAQNATTDLVGLNDASGLLDLAADSARTPRDMVVATAIPNLSFLPIGGREWRREISASIPVVEVVELLAQHFANCIIVLDTAPCLSSSTPAALAQIVGQTVMVVEAEQTQLSEIESAVGLLQACPIITVMLNKARLTGGDTFGAYY